MSSVTTFRGVAGEVVCRTCHPKVFLTLIPLVLAWFVIGTLLSFGAGRLGIYFPAAVLVFCWAYFVGRFALPAVRGHFDHGLLTNVLEPAENILFAARYFFLFAVWVVVIYLLGRFILAKAGMSMMLGLATFSPVVLLQGGVAGFALIIVLLIAIFAPMVTLLVTCATTSLGDALSITPWRWALITRFADLLVLYAACIGGVAVFFLLYAVPLALLAMAANATSEKLGLFILQVASGLPVAVGPVLMGRMAGAFVFGTDIIDEEQPLKAHEILREAEQMGATVGLQPIEALAGDPPEEVVGWVRERLPGCEDVVSAYLFRQVPAAGEVYLALGLELSADAKLGVRQSIQRELQGEFAGVVGSTERGKVLLISDEMRPQIEAVGLRIYGQRPG